MTFKLFNAALGAGLVALGTFNAPVLGSLGVALVLAQVMGTDTTAKDILNNQRRAHMTAADRFHEDLMNQL